jgi:hypothetical protein
MSVSIPLTRVHGHRANQQQSDAGAYGAARKHPPLQPQRRPENTDQEVNTTGTSLFLLSPGLAESGVTDQSITEKGPIYQGQAGSSSSPTPHTGV